MHLSDAQRLALGLYRCRWMPGGMRLNPAARPVPCQGRPDGWRCLLRAGFVEHRTWTGHDAAGIAFDYYCVSCWTVVGPTGTSPQQRAMVPHWVRSKS